MFVTTRWTLVRRARGNESEAQVALSELCEAYWLPVFRFLKREGRSEDDARELAQEFFSRVLARGGLGDVDPGRGRFRSYLLGALKHFLADRRRDARRQKRGGEAEVMSVDSAGGTEASPGLELADPGATPNDSWFDRQWALAVMGRALEVVQSGFRESGKANHFEVLKVWLTGDTGNLSQANAASQLGVSVGAVKVAIHRMRKGFRKAIHDEIAQTVDGQDAVAEELRYLIEVLRSSPAPDLPGPSESLGASKKS